MRARAIEAFKFTCLDYPSVSAVSTVSLLDVPGRSVEGSRFIKSMAFTQTPLDPTRPGAVIFDFDGTLADTIPMALEVTNEIGPMFGMEHVTDDLAEELRGMPLKQVISRVGLKPRKIPQFQIELRRRMRDRVATLPTFPGVEKALGALQDTGVKLGILSSNTRENVEAFLASHGMRDYFGFVDGGSSLFGKARHLRRILKTELGGLSAASLVYVGDETRDIEAAKKVGAMSAGVTWGVAREPVIAAAMADFIIRSPEGLGELVQ